MSTKKKTSAIRPSPYFKYSTDAMTSAISAIQKDGISVRGASRRFGVPRSSLQDRLSGKVVLASHIRQMGPDSVLTAEEENKLAEWLVDLAKSGFPRKRHELLDSVQKIVKSSNRKTPFTDGRPGKKWYASFMMRHPQLVHREPENLSKGRAAITEEYIRKWFKDLEECLKEIGAEDVLTDANRILNGDETSFCLCPKSGKVIAPRGWRNVYDIKTGNDKENITVLLVFSASGKTLQPMVVFPFIRVPKDIVTSMPDDWYLGRSETGWMKSDIFFEYVANCVAAWMKAEEIKQPVLLLVDGHKTHLTLELSEFCSQNGIILYALPANTTHIIQPADVSVFKPLKSDWKITVRPWLNEPENLNQVLTKSKFCPLLKKVLEQPNIPKSIQSGFRRCGLFSFNPYAVDYSKCVQNRLENTNRSDQKIHKLDLKDIISAEKVIDFPSMKDIFIGKGVNCKIVLEVLRQEKAKMIDTNPPENIGSNSQISNSLESFEGNFQTYPSIEEDIILHDLSTVEIILDNSVYVEDGSHTLIGSDVDETHMDLSRTSLTLDENACETVIMNGIEITAHQEDQTCFSSADFEISSSSIKTAKEKDVSAKSCNSNDNLASNQSETINSELINLPDTSGTNISFNQNTPSKSCPDANPPLIPSPFKKHLFCPKPIPKSTKVRNDKEKAPSAISSAKWRDFVLKKEKQKEELEKKKLRRKEERMLLNARKITDQAAKKKKGVKSSLCESKSKRRRVSKSDSDHDSETIAELSAEETKPLAKIWKFGRTFSHLKPFLKTQPLDKDEWVVVAFNNETGKKRFWIGQVLGADPEDSTKFQGTFIQPKVTKKHCGYIYGHPNIPDIYPFDHSSVVGKLANPETYGRGLYKFQLHHDQLKS